MSRGSINGSPPVDHTTPLNHFAVHRPRAAKPLRYAPGVCTLLGRANPVLVNSTPAPKGGLAASVEPCPRKAALPSKTCLRTIAGTHVFHRRGKRSSPAEHPPRSIRSEPAKGAAAPSFQPRSNAAALGLQGSSSKAQRVRRAPPNGFRNWFAPRSVLREFLKRIDHLRGSVLRWSFRVIDDDDFDGALCRLET
jgi:hypothetical protein